MKALTLTVLLLLLVCSSGCRWGLPEGEAPVGNLVDNPIPEKLSREQLILSLGSRIAASSMELFPGGPITVEGKETSAALLAKAAVTEAGKICGVRHAVTAAAVLNSRKLADGTFEFELFYFNRSLWRCSYELKKSLKNL